MSSGKRKQLSELPGARSSMPLPALLRQILSTLPLSFTRPQILSGVEEQPGEVIWRAREEAAWAFNVKFGKY